MKRLIDEARRSATYLKPKLLAILALAFASLTYPLVASANPVFNNVTAGGAQVSQTATTTTIKQTSDRAILNWHSFNIANGEKTQFIQPSVHSSALNRIDPTQGVSQIYGSLVANGQVILINAAGIHFGPTAMVNVGSIIASTSDISDDNFLNGKYIFDKPSNLGGTISNEGTIIAASHGLVALLGANVTNNGMIQAREGSIVLGTGNTFTLDFYGDQLINFSVGESATSGGKIKNNGSLIADGGKVLVTARAAQGVLDNAIYMGGVAQARSVRKVNGEIILDGGTGNVVVAGEISTKGNLNNSGGTIKVTGNNITLSSSAKLNANGKDGGKIFIGGNQQGKGPLPNATTTYIAQGAEIHADALNGNGGEVIVWSNDRTDFHGVITAFGVNGNGGFVETSGKNFLDISNGFVTTMASNGKTGSWLLDPANVTISTGADANYTNISNAFTPNSGAATSTINTTTLATALATNNIIVTTTNNGTSGGSAGNITVASALSWASGNSLTLQADNNIAINAAITIGNSSAAQLILNAPGSITQTATIGGLGSLVKQGAGTLTLSLANTYSGGTTIEAGVLSANNVNRIGSGALTINGGTYSYTGGSASLTRPITIGASGGTIQVATTLARTLTLTGGITNNGVLVFDSAGTAASNITVSTNGISGSGNVIKTNTGSALGVLTFGAVNTYTGSTSINSGELQLTNINGLGSGATQSSSTTVASGADLNLNFASGTLGNTNTITLNGTGVSNLGALVSNTTTMTVNNNIVLGSNASIGGPNTMVLNGVISDGGNGYSLTKVGANTITLSNANTYSGGTTISAGNLTLTNANALGTIGNIIIDNGTLGLNIGNTSLANINAITMSGTTAAITAAVTANMTNTLANAINVTTGTASFTSSTNNGLLDLSGVITSNGPSNFVFTGTGDITVNGGITGTATGSVTKSGTGILTFNASNTYSGGTSITAGTLVVNNKDALSSTGNIDLTGSAILSMDLGGNILTNSSPISLAGTSRITSTVSAGLTDTLNNSISVTGTTNTITSTNATASLTFAGAIANAGTTLAFAGAGNTNLTNTLSGSAAISKSGTGTLTISGNNTGFSGTTNVTAGTLRLTNANALGSTGAITISSATLSANFGGNVFGNTNTLTLTGTSNLIDDIASGTDTFTNAITLTTGGANRTFTSSNLGATLALNGLITPNNASIVFNGAGDITVGGGIAAGTADVKMNGTGTLNINAITNYTGATTLSSGSIKAGAANVLASTSAFTVTGTLDLNSFAQTIGSLAGAGTVTLSANLTTGSASNTTFSGDLSTGGGGIIKQGAGTFTLSGASNAYTGSTQINDGTLSVSNINGLGNTSAINVATGATLNTAFNGTLVNTSTITLNGDGVGGNGALTSTTSTGSLNNNIILASNVTFGGNTNLSLNPISGNISDGTSSFSITKVGNGIITFGAANTYDGGTNVNAGTLTVTNKDGLGTGSIVINNATLGLNLGGNQLGNTSGITMTGASSTLTTAATAGTTNTVANIITLTGTTATFSSTTNNGILRLITGGITSNGAANIIFTGGGDIVVDAGISGTASGSVTKSGTGDVTFNTANSYTGGTSLTTGRLFINNKDALGSTGNIDLSGSATLLLNLGGNHLANASALSMSGTALITDTVAAGLTDSLDNSITISGTNHTITSTNATANLVFTNNIANNGTTLTFTGSGDITQSGAGIWSGSGDLTKTGSGTLYLTNLNTYTGVTTINAGILNFNSIANANGTPSALGAPTSSVNGTIVIGNNDTLFYSGSGSTSDRIINLTGNNATLDASGAGTLTLNGDVTGGFNLILTGTGSGVINGTINAGSSATLTKNGTGAWTLGSANSYSGNTTLTDGTLAVGNNASLGSGTLLLSGGMLSAISAVTLANPFTVSANLSSGIGGNSNIIFAGAGTFNNNSTLQITNTGITTFGTLDGNVNNRGTLTSTAGAGIIVFADNVGSNSRLDSINLASNATLNQNVSITTNTSQTYAGLLLAGLSGTNTLNQNGSGTVTLGGTTWTAGSSAILNINADNIIINGTLNGSSAGAQGSINLIAGGQLTLNAAINANLSGNSIVISTARFVNNFGASALNPGAGNFLVWSSNPNPFGGSTPDVTGGIVYNFKQYNATFGVTPVAGTGNGFLYTLAPFITPSLTGTISKVYDTTTNANLTNSNFATTGEVDGDTVTINNTLGFYDNANAGTNKTVSASGITILSATNGSAIVYGYQLSTTTATSNNGVIIQAPLTVVANNASKTILQPNPIFTYQAYGFLAGDNANNSLTGALTRQNPNSNIPGHYAILQGTLASTNYAISYTPGVLTIEGSISFNNTISNVQGIITGPRDQLSSNGSSILAFYKRFADLHTSIGMIVIEGKNIETAKYVTGKENNSFKLSATPAENSGISSANL